MANIEHTAEYKQFLISAKQNIEYAQYLLVLSTKNLINDKQLFEKTNDELKQLLSELMLSNTQLKELESQGQLIISQEMQIRVAQAETRLTHLENYTKQILTQIELMLGIDTVRWWGEVLISRHVDAFEYYVSRILLKELISCPNL